MVDCDRVGAAGHFLITRAGKIGKIVCMSSDYWLNFEDQHHVTVRYLIDSFSNHQAFDLSRHATFQFSRALADNFWVSPDGQPVDDHAERLRLAEFEGQGSEELPPFSLAQVRAFARYLAEPPPRLYPLQQDHLVDPIDFDDHEPIEVGDFQAPYSPGQGRLTSGRKAFIFDDKGRLVVGYGHHLLAGANPVGAAGQISVDEAGIVTEIHLNFSGHYRPPLSAEYARYAYHSLVDHPLLEFADDCKINARGSFNMSSNFEMVSFSAEELLTTDRSLELKLDRKSKVEPDDDDLRLDFDWD